MDRSAIKKMHIREASSDAAYWRTRPPEERLSTVEVIRREYHDWPEEETTNEDFPRLQRVYRVCKRA